MPTLIDIFDKYIAWHELNYILKTLKAEGYFKESTYNIIDFFLHKLFPEAEELKAFLDIDLKEWQETIGHEPPKGQNEYI